MQMKDCVCTNHDTVPSTSHRSSVRPPEKGSAPPLACVEMVAVVAKVQGKLLAGAVLWELESCFGAGMRTSRMAAWLAVLSSRRLTREGSSSCLLGSCLPASQHRENKLSEGCLQLRLVNDSSKQGLFLPQGPRERWSPPSASLGA
jgi:hypothetical protein